MKSLKNNKNIDVKSGDDKISKHPVVIVSKTEMQWSEMSKIYFKKSKNKKDNEVIKMKNKINEKNNLLFL